MGPRFLMPALLLLVQPVFSGSAGYSDSEFLEAIKGVSEDCPQWILDNQVLMDVVYWGFDDEVHHGRLVVDDRVVGDLQLVFILMYLIRFPLESVVPICDFDWDDGLSMAANNTSGFNYRTVAGTDRLSRHAYGLAIDINPFQNPYCVGNHVSPAGAVYDPSEPGTLYAGHPVVLLFKELGWRWGGDWSEKDYQHFDRQIELTGLDGVEHRRYWPPWRVL
ncbi:MAG: M15 family metallopeptidase [Candidatus Fermentibacteraceae bacterium]|nr:M15 family metallopeptidase [Candidatus Fermentibacteraceae bacterium]